MSLESLHIPTSWETMLEVLTDVDPLGDPNSFKHVRGLPCALSGLYFLCGNSGIMFPLSQCLTH